MKIILLSAAAISTAIASYLTDFSIEYANQFIVVILLIFIDGLFGIIQGIKKEGFIVSKAMKVVKDSFLWSIVLSLLILVEKNIPGVSWISESILAPFVLFQVTSILKNLSKTTNSPVLNQIVSKIHNTSNLN